MTALSTDPDTLARQAAFGALLALSRRVPLSFPTVAAAIEEHRVARADIPLLLRDLLDAGARLPGALTQAAEPVAPRVPAERAGTRGGRPGRSPIRPLHGHETLDLSRISLADLGLPPVPGQRSGPVEAVLAPVAEPVRAEAEAVRPEPEEQVTAEPEGTGLAPDGAGPDEIDLAGLDPDEPGLGDPTAEPDERAAGAEGPFGEPDQATEDWRRSPGVDLVILYRKQAARYPLLDADEEVELARRIEAGVLAQERLERGGVSPGPARDLRRLVRDGRRAFETFVNANLRLVVSIAVRHCGRGLDFPDLIQEGNLGLIRAVQKFDFTKGYKFSTYATWWIRQAVTRALAEQSRTIRYPVHVVDDLTRVRKAESDLRARGEEPGPEAIATAAGVPVEKVRELRDGLPTTCSLEGVLDVLGEQAIREMMDRSQVQAPPDLRGFEPEYFERALESCTERERHILRRRFGFVGEPATLDEIGKDLGITRERVRQIVNKTLPQVERMLWQQAARRV